MLAALVAGQPILEPIIIGFVGDKDMGSELQNRRAIEGSGRDIDQLRWRRLKVPWPATAVPVRVRQRAPFINDLTNYR